MSNYSKTIFQVFGGDESYIPIEFDNELVGYGHIILYNIVIKIKGVVEYV